MTYRPDSVVATSSGGKEFTPHPEGQFVGVCVDVINLGEKAEEFEGKMKNYLTPKVALVWRTEEKREDGHYFEVAREFTLSTSPKGNLRPFLTAWRGKSFSDAEAKRFDVSVLAGAPAVLTIEHRTSSTGRDHANVIGISRPMKGTEIPDVSPSSYVRGDWWEKRKKEYAEGAAKWKADRAAAGHEEPEPIEPGEAEDDLPFSVER